MQRIKSFFEYKAILFTVLIIGVVVTIGFLLYKKLSDVSGKISDSLKQEIPSSLIARQMILELRQAENNAKSYQLTQELTYIQSFYKAEPEIEKSISSLKKLAYEEKETKPLIDSFINLSRLHFELIKTQSYVSDPSKVTEELNIISQKIDETYKYEEKRLEKPTSIIPTDTTKKKEGFFKRLFKKKEKLKDTIVESTTPKKIEKKVALLDSKRQLKYEVQKVKQTQLLQLEEYKQNEYKYNQSANIIRERMNSIAEKLKQKGDLKTMQAAKKAKEEINALKLNAIVFSVVISFFLFTLVYLIVSYVRKKNQYELALLNSKKQSDDLAKAKELFLANMSHEIKTPLNAIYGFTEQILSSDLNPEQKNQLTIVKNSAAYLTKLVGDILTYSKMQSGKSKLEFVNFSIRKELNEIEALFKIQTDAKNISLSIDYARIQSEFISTDLYKLKQVLFNLIGNAVKFTNRGGVTIYLKQSHQNEREWLEIIVSDTGRGIEEQQMTKLFNEYEQGDDRTAKKYGGTGLGLVITKQIVEQLGGSISIKSKIKTGTNVTVQIPFAVASGETTETHGEKEWEVILSKINGKHILIVDDEEFNRLLLKSILKKNNVVVYEASNGLEAIEMVKTKSLDLIIMDIRMPEKSGIEATLEIRKFNGVIPIIAATAFVSEEKIAKCIQAGMNAVIFKPFKEKELLKIVADDYSSGLVKIVLDEKEALNKSSAKQPINLDSISEFVNNDENFKREMVQIFYKSINQTTQDIEMALNEKQYERISDLAHKIIPSCRHFEAHELSNTLKFLESIKNKSNFSEVNIEKHCAVLKEQVKQINLVIESYLE